MSIFAPPIAPIAPLDFAAGQRRIELAANDAAALHELASTWFNDEEKTITRFALLQLLALMRHYLVTRKRTPSNTEPDVAQFKKHVGDFFNNESKHEWRKHLAARLLQLHLAQHELLNELLTAMADVQITVLEEIMQKLWINQHPMLLIVALEQVTKHRMQVRRVRKMLTRVNIEVKRAFKNNPPVSRDAATKLVESWIAPIDPSSSSTGKRPRAQEEDEETKDQENDGDKEENDGDEENKEPKAKRQGMAARVKRACELAKAASEEADISMVAIPDSDSIASSSAPNVIVSSIASADVVQRLEQELSESRAAITQANLELATRVQSAIRITSAIHGLVRRIETQRIRDGETHTPDPISVLLQQIIAQQDKLDELVNDDETQRPLQHLRVSHSMASEWREHIALLKSALAPGNRSVPAKQEERRVCALILQWIKQLEDKEENREPLTHIQLLLIAMKLQCIDELLPSSFQEDQTISVKKEDEEEEEGEGAANNIDALLFRALQCPRMIDFVKRVPLQSR